MGRCSSKGLESPQETRDIDWAIRLQQTIDIQLVEIKHLQESNMILKRKLARVTGRDDSTTTPPPEAIRLLCPRQHFGFCNCIKPVDVPIATVIHTLDVT